MSYTSQRQAEYECVAHMKFCLFLINLKLFDENTEREKIQKTSESVIVITAKW